MANAHGSATSWEQPAWIPHPAGAAEPGLGPVEDTRLRPGRNDLPAPPDDTRPVSRLAASPATLAPIG
jgi:hypothetical protein